MPSLSFLGPTKVTVLGLCGGELLLKNFDIVSSGTTGPGVGGRLNEDGDEQLLYTDRQEE